MFGIKARFEHHHMNRFFGISQEPPGDLEIFPVEDYLHILGGEGYRWGMTKKGYENDQVKTEHPHHLCPPPLSIIPWLAFLAV
jgi:hypothetical protein